MNKTNIKWYLLYQQQHQSYLSLYHKPNGCSELLASSVSVLDPFMPPSFPQHMRMRQ